MICVVVFHLFVLVKMDVYSAARDNDLDRMRLLVEQSPDKDKCDSDGQTTLYLASFFGRPEMVQYLVEQRVTLDKANNWGKTPLGIAAVNDHLNVCRYLLEQGADRDKANDNVWDHLGSNMIVIK